MEGIIKICGTVADVTYQRDSFVTIKLSVESVQRKLMSEESFSEPEKITGRVVNLPYHSSIGLDKIREKSFCFGPEVKRTTFGYGVSSNDINTDDRIVVYVHWRMVSNAFRNNHLVIDEVVMQTLDPRPESALDFISSLLS